MMPNGQEELVMFSEKEKREQGELESWLKAEQGILKKYQDSRQARELLITEKRKELQILSGREAKDCQDDIDALKRAMEIEQEYLKHQEERILLIGMTVRWVVSYVLNKEREKANVRGGKKDTIKVIEEFLKSYPDNDLAKKFLAEEKSIAEQIEIFDALVAWHETAAKLGLPLIALSAEKAVYEDMIRKGIGTSENLRKNIIEIERKEEELKKELMAYEHADAVLSAGLSDLVNRVSDRVLKIDIQDEQKKNKKAMQISEQDRAKYREIIQSKVSSTNQFAKGILEGTVSEKTSSPAIGKPAPAVASKPPVLARPKSPSATQVPVASGATKENSDFKAKQNQIAAALQKKPDATPKKPAQPSDLDGLSQSLEEKAAKKAALEGLLGGKKPAQDRPKSTSSIDSNSTVSVSSVSPVPSVDESFTPPPPPPAPPAGGFPPPPPPPPPPVFTGMQQNSGPKTPGKKWADPLAQEGNDKPAAAPKSKPAQPTGGMPGLGGMDMGAALAGLKKRSPVEPAKKEEPAPTMLPLAKKTFKKPGDVPPPVNPKPGNNPSGH